MQIALSQRGPGKTGSEKDRILGILTWDFSLRLQTFPFTELFVYLAEFELKLSKTAFFWGFDVVFLLKSEKFVKYDPKFKVFDLPGPRWCPRTIVVPTHGLARKCPESARRR